MNLPSLYQIGDTIVYRGEWRPVYGVQFTLGQVRYLLGTATDHWLVPSGDVEPTTDHYVGHDTPDVPMLGESIPTG